jgi:signal transduction histidine kinase/ActR/RegA family two-component response regulator
VPPVQASPGVRDVLRRVIVLQAGLLVVVALLATVAVLSYRRAESDARRTGDVLVQLEALRAEVLSAETGFRGFLLTGQDAFLEPYQRALPRLEQREAAVRKQLDGPERQILDALRSNLGEWREQFAEVVLGDLGTGHREAALHLVTSGAGKIRIDRVRAYVDDLEARAERRLEDRRDTAQQRAELGLLLAVVALVALVVTVYLGRRRLQRSVGDPLRSLAMMADRLAEGDLGTRSTARGVAEVERVALAFNEMATATESTVRELRAVDRIKSEFVSVVSHELRTPLTSIRGSLGLLASGAMGQLPPEAAEMLRIAVSNTDRLVRLINDILDLERIEAGREALEIRPVSVAQVLADAASVVGGAAEDGGVRLDVEPVEATVQADADRLVQAVTNLAGNAIKFSDRGDRVVLRGVVEGGEVLLQVVDEGRGIPPEKLEAVFERFQQVDGSDAREKGGTGLGLAITRSIVERHGGRVEVESALGLGSTFSLVLPLAPGTRDRRIAGGRVGSELVVVVEDDLDLREVVGATLGRHGLDIANAATAEEAVALCQERDPQLLVLDVKLASGSAYDVVRMLRQDDRLRNLPTVVYTVVDLGLRAQEALRLGETVFVTKGAANEDGLEQAVLRLLGRDGQAEAGVTSR